MNKMNEWSIVHNSDMKDGIPTLWSIKVADGKFYWIKEVEEGWFDIINHDAKKVLKTCKTLVSAKRWVSINLLWPEDDEETVNKKRAKVLEELHNMAKELIKHYSRDLYYEIFTIASDWNSEHSPNLEIFVCDIEKNEDYKNNGIMIEDDLYIYEE